MARLVSVNVGRPKQIATRRGRPYMSSIGKQPVDGRVRVEGVNVAGDQQSDLRVHGGPDKAVYAYALEDTAWWTEHLGLAQTPLPAGIFGENLSTEGVDVTGAVIGEHWSIGSVELEVCQPRQPCVKLGIQFGNARMVKAFALAERPGAYLRIVTPGEVGAGDTITVHDRPEHGITIQLVARAILLDGDLLPTAVQAPELPGDLAEWMRERAAA